jgi:mRNA interferase YafQ
LRVVWTTQFRKDYKRAKKQGQPLKELKTVVGKLTRGERLGPKYKDHPLKGCFKKEHRECHIRADWLLIYRFEEDALVLVRSGTHSDLFK